jgi:TP901 family phage tail tape measure protein
MAVLDKLWVDIGLSGHQGTMSALNGFKSYLNGLKANLKAVGIASGAGLSAMTVKLAADLEQSRLRLKRFVDSDFNNLTAGIDRMAAKMPIAIDGLYEIASGAAQVGVEGTKNILAFTEVVGKLSSVSSMSFNETAKDLAKLHNVFNLKPTDSVRTANVIAGMSAASAADPSELITLTKYMAPAAATIGFTLDQTIALSAGIKDVGLSSEVAGTQMTQLMTKMASSPELFANVIDKTVSDFKKLRDADPLKALIATLKAIESQPSLDDKIAAFDMLGMDGSRSATVNLALISGLELVVQQLDKAKKFGDEKTILDKQFNETAQGTYQQLQKLGNSFILFAGELEESSLNIIKPAAQAFAGALEHLSNVIKEIKDLAGGGDPNPNENAIAKVRNVPKGWMGGLLEMMGMIPAMGGGAADPVGGDLKVKQIDKVQQAINNAEREERIAAENLGVTNDEITARKNMIAKLEAEANEIARGIKDPNDPAGMNKLGLLANTLAQHDKLLGEARNKAFEQELKLTEAKAKVAAAKESPEAKAIGAQIKQGARKFAFDKMVDPQGFAQFQQAFNALPKEMLDTDAGRNIAKKLQAMGGADVFKQMTEEELAQLVGKRAGAFQNVAAAVAQERMGKLFAKPQFQGADESWKRIQSGALEGDPMTRILKENARLHKEQTKATEALKTMVAQGIAEIKDNVIMLVGAP